MRPNQKGPVPSVVGEGSLKIRGRQEGDLGEIDRDIQEGEKKEDERRGIMARPIKEAETATGGQ